MRRLAWIALALVLSVLPALAAGVDDQLVTAAQVQQILSDRARDEVRKAAEAQLGNLATTIFDYEAKKKEMEALLKDAEGKVTTGVKTTKAIVDLWWATPGYRREVGKNALITGAKKLTSQLPVGGYAVEVALDAANALLDLEASEPDQFMIDTCLNATSFKFAHVFVDASSALTQKVVEKMDGVCKRYGTSLEELGRVYQNFGDETSKQAALEILKRNKVEEKLKALIEAARKKIGTGPKPAELQGKQDAAVDKLRKARDAVKSAEDEVSRLQGERAKLALQDQQLGATIRAGTGPAALRASEDRQRVRADLGNLDSKILRAQGAVDKARDAVTDTYNKFSDAYDANQASKRNQELIAQAKEIGEAALEKAGIDKDALADLVRDAQAELEKVRGQIAYWEKKKEQVQHLLGHAAQLAEAARGFYGLAEKFKDHADDARLMMQVLQGGEIKLKDLRRIEEASVSFVKAQLVGMPQRLAAVADRIKAYDPDRVREAFREQATRELALFEDVPVQGVQKARKYLIDQGDILLKQFTEWDPLESTCRHASLSIL